LLAEIIDKVRDRKWFHEGGGVSNSPLFTHKKIATASN
jgi:hypothetical protein